MAHIDDPEHRRSTPPDMPSSILADHVQRNDVTRPDKAAAAWKIIRNLTLLALIAAGGVFVLMIIGNAVGKSGIRQELRQVIASRPDPVVAEQSLNTDESNFWDASVTLVGTVRNKGADGYVLIKGVMQQGGHYYTRESHRYLNREEECAVKYTFDEVTAGGGKMRGHIEVYPAQ